ncbi:sialate O-acetylesterase [Bradyrhizobium japonicum]|uniref:sialate O-acetylesterase n=1 Tax=Bradyrhizobium japonicum TaxID=375 RepID=UPI003D9AEA10
MRGGGVWSPDFLPHEGCRHGHYQAVAAQIVAATHDLEFIVWHQGEGDSANGTSQAAYLAQLDALNGSFATDFGRSKSTIPLVLSGLGTVTGGASGYGTDASWDAMERTLLDARSRASIIRTATVTRSLSMPTSTTMRQATAAWASATLAPLRHCSARPADMRR